MSHDDSDGLDGVDVDSGVLEPDESLDDRGVEDVLDEGYSPAERSWSAAAWGLTPREAADHEPLDRRLRSEVVEVVPAYGDELGDVIDTDGELYDDQVGVGRSGRLVEDDNADSDYPYIYATDVGIDGAAASAEEAAVHIIVDDGFGRNQLPVPD
jgi:hypothetical protein